MALTVRFLDSLLLDATLMEGEETVLCLSLHSKRIRHCIITSEDGVLRVYKLLRPRTGPHPTPIRTLITQTEEALLTFHRREIKGLTWGYPVINRINNNWFLFLNDIPVVDQYGNLTDYFKTLLEQYQIKDPDTTEVVNYINSVKGEILYHSAIEGE